MAFFGLLAAVALFSIVGTFIGIITGIVPGLHMNNVTFLVIMAQPAFGTLALVVLGAGTGGAGGGSVSQVVLALLLSCVIVSLVIAHTFVNAIPGIFLGVPSGDTVLTVLPGHRMLLKGRGFEAVKLSAIGSAGAIALSLALLPLLRFVMGDPVELYSRLRPHIPVILGLVILLLVVTERGERRHRERRDDMAYLDCELVVPMRPGADIEGLRRPSERVPTVAISDVDRFLGEVVIIAGKVTEVLEGGGGGFMLWDGSAIEVRRAEKGGEASLRCDGPEDIPEPGSAAADVGAGHGVGVSVGDHVWVRGIVMFPTRRSAPTSFMKQRGRSMMWALFLFFLSGILGLVLLANAWVPDLARPLVPQLALIPGLVILFPLFTGLFGLPTLILSLLDKAEVRPQCMDGKVTLPRGRGLRGVITGTLSGTFVGWYPGVTGAQASVIAASMSSLVDRLNGQWKGKGKMFRAPEASGHDTKEFLVSMAAVGTANAIFNMVAMFTIFKARSGALKGVMTVMGPGLVAWSPISSPPVTLLLFLFAVLISGVISYLAMLLIGRFMARNYSRVPYTKLAAGIIIMILVMLFVVAGPLGLAITGISLCLGLLPPLVGVRRVHLMGCIMLPVICFQLGLAG